MGKIKGTAQPLTTRSVARQRSSRNSRARAGPNSTGRARPTAAPSGSNNNAQQAAAADMVLVDVDQDFLHRALERLQDLPDEVFVQAEAEFRTLRSSNEWAIFVSMCPELASFTEKLFRLDD